MILYAIFTGSMAIHVLNLKAEAEDRERTTKQLTRTLKRVINQVRNGEDVDIRAELGTGNPAMEKEWEELVKRVETDASWISLQNPNQRGRGSKEQAGEAPKKDETVKSSAEQTNTAPSKPAFY